MNVGCLGQETTSTVMAWLLIYLIKSPDVQKRMHQEMDQVINGDRLITTADKPNLPYTSAVINEGLRFILYSIQYKVGIQFDVLDWQTF